MTLGLDSYFERELAFLFDSREAFQKRYPAEAGRLIPDRSKVPDPHLDRFIEGFAAICGRIHRKLRALPETPAGGRARAPVPGSILQAVREGVPALLRACRAARVAG